MEQIDQLTLFKIIRAGKPYNKEAPIINGYQFVESEITGNDPEDGGGDYSLIIMRVEDGKFFAIDYQGWDVDYNTTVISYDEHYEPSAISDSDLPTDLQEVYPQIIQKTIYTNQKQTI